MSADTSSPSPTQWAQRVTQTMQWLREMMSKKEKLTSTEQAVLQAVVFAMVNDRDAPPDLSRYRIGGEHPVRIETSITCSAEAAHKAMEALMLLFGKKEEK